MIRRSLFQIPKCIPNKIEHRPTQEQITMFVFLNFGFQFCQNKILLIFFGGNRMTNLIYKSSTFISIHRWLKSRLNIRSSQVKSHTTAHLSPQKKTLCLKTQLKMLCLGRQAWGLTLLFVHRKWKRGRSQSWSIPNYTEPDRKIESIKAIGHFRLTVLSKTHTSCITTYI